jgi:antitoxin component of RelBE/YafQ-DinJ toxin-antitoxin module
MRGAPVCRMHGGSAPQVRAKAEDRIRALVDPALSRLAQLIDHADLDSVKLAAVKDVLDRAGLAAKQQVEITIRQQAEQIAAQLGIDPDELIAEAERIVAGSR